MAAVRERRSTLLRRRRRTERKIKLGPKGKRHLAPRYVVSAGGWAGRRMEEDGGYRIKNSGSRI